MRQAGAAGRARDTLEPATASGLAPWNGARDGLRPREPTAGPSCVTPEAERAPGLRYADKDKPL
jgi:hypothetical protein